MHLKPTDFFTQNPALDVPSKPNKTSVLVSSCCGNGKNGDAAGKATVQEEALSHLQGGSDIDAQKAGANVDVNDKEDDPKLVKRLSRSLTGLFRPKSIRSQEGSSFG